MRELLSTPSIAGKVDRGKGIPMSYSLQQIDDAVAERSKEGRFLTVHILAPMTGPQSYMSSNIDSILDYIEKTNIIRYKNNIDINVHDTQSSTAVFSSIVSSLLRNGERYFVHIGDSNDAKAWVDLTEKYNPESDTCPVMFSCTSTAHLDGRTPTLIRLTANDNAMFQALTLKLQQFTKKDGKDVLVYCENTVYGNNLKELFEEEYPECFVQLFDASNYQNFGGDLDQEQQTIVFVGNDEYCKTIYNSIIHKEDQSYFFYDALVLSADESDKYEFTYFFEYVGELVNSNKFKTGIVEEFVENYSSTIGNYELSLIDIVNALSYSTVARRQNIPNLMSIISSYGQYSGSFHFNGLGDRDNHFFASFVYSPELGRLSTNSLTRINESLYIDGDEKYSLTMSDVNIIEDFTVVTDTSDSFTERDIVIFNYVKLIDITGRPYLVGADERNLGVFKIAMSDTVYAENTDIIYYMSPAISKSQDGSVVSYTEWSKKTDEILMLKGVVASKAKKAKENLEKAGKKVGNTVRAAKKASDDLNRNVYETGQTVISQTTGAVDNTVSVLNRIKDGLPPQEAFDLIVSDFKSRKDNITAKAQDLSKSFSAVLESVKEVGFAIGSSISELTFCLREAALDLLSGETLGILLELIIEKGQPLLAKIFSNIAHSKSYEIAKTVFVKAIEIGGEIFTTYTSILSDVVDDMKGLSTMVGKLIEWVIGDPNIIEKLTNMVDLAVKFWTAQLSPFIDYLVERISNLGATIVLYLTPLVEKLFQRLITDFETLKPYLNRIITFFSGVMQKVDWNTVATMVKHITSNIGNLGTFIKFLTTGEDSILSLVKEQIEIVIDMIDFDSMVAAVKDFETLITTISDLIGGVTGLSTIIAEMVKGFFGSLTEEIGAIIKRIIDNVYPTIQDLTTKLMPYITTLFNSLEPILNGMKSIFVPIYNSLNDSGAFQPILDIFTGQLGGANFSKYMRKVLDVLSDEDSLLNQVVKAVINIVQTIATTAKDVFDLIGDIIDIVDSVVNIDSLSGLMKSIVETGSKVVDIGIPTNFKSLLKTLMTFFKPLVKKLKSVFTDIIDKFIDMFKPLFEELFGKGDSQIVDAIGEIASLITDVLSTVIELVISVLSALASVITITTRILEILGNTIFPYLITIITPLKQTIDTIVNLIKNLLFALKLVIQPLVDSFGFILNVVLDKISAFGAEDEPTDMNSANSTLDLLSFTSDEETTMKTDPANNSETISFIDNLVSFGAAAAA